MTARGKQEDDRRRPLPDLVDCSRLQRELGVSKAAAERIMRHVPKVTFEGLRKVYVKRDDVARLIKERTFDDTIPTHYPR